MVGIKFIHTADIHLGSLLHIGGGKLPPAVEQAAVTATMEGFSRVCHAAIKNRVDFVVISGDLYAHSTFDDTVYIFINTHLGKIRSGQGCTCDSEDQKQGNHKVVPIGFGKFQHPPYQLPIINPILVFASVIHNKTSPFVLSI
jgi:hypothetical protein